MRKYKCRKNVINNFKNDSVSDMKTERSKLNIAFNYNPIKLFLHKDISMKNKYIQFVFFNLQLLITPLSTMWIKGVIYKEDRVKMKEAHLQLTIYNIPKKMLSFTKALSLVSLKTRVTALSENTSHGVIPGITSGTSDWIRQSIININKNIAQNDIILST